ncbi:pseudouridine synthase [Microvirga alba]|uniref:Pseudouridine synthase n=1 Tax=Microvirga alba TaxID=2791025 RepID=A0A931BP76_9HYPH|nr:pseudouridine synthase [Microvirga alba]MBF9234916.1 pseudouridine synthase [Microvirga alba]
MTDSNDDNRKGRSSGRPDRGRTSGDRPPFRKPREDGDRPFRARAGDERPRKVGDKPFRPRGEGGDKPFRSRDNDERPRRPREGGDKPFRARREEGDRPFKPRGEGGDRPFRPRREEGDKPFRPRREEGDRPFRAKREDGDRPFRGRGGEDRPRRFDRAREDRPQRAREERPVAQVEPQEPAEDRIAKVIARAGVASRRDAEAMIAEGRVTLNGKVLESPAINVTAADEITVDGEPLPVKERTRLWMFHKPRGLVTTARDPEGRPTVFDNLPEDLPRVVAIGRLDINTEGLLLLTNDGGLARVIAHPDTGWLRRYKVRAHGEVTQADLDKLRDGVTVDEMEYGPVEARLDRVQGDNAWITLGLREGKNREVKRILEHLGLQVNRLIRLSFGPFQLGDIEPGMVEEVRTRTLRDQLGAALAAEAGVDFESPVREPIAPFGSPKKAEHEERQERRGERPSRFARDRDEERPRRHREEGGMPFRARGDERRGRDEEEPRKRPSRLEVKTSVWRADEGEEPARKKAPRRGADPREARVATGQRAHQRVGAIESSEGRKVLVERLVSEPKEEAPARKPRRDASRPAPGGEDRPHRRMNRDERPSRSEGGFERPRRDDDRPRRPAGDKPFRARSDEGDRPRRPAGDKPFRARSEEGAERPRKPQGDRPFRARGDDDRPRRPAGDRPFRARSEEGGDRPRKPQGDRPFRARSDEGDRPRRPRPEGDRPFRSRDGDKPFRAGGDDRPRRGPPRGDGPPRGGPKGRPGGGFKSGGPKGGSKGGPKGGPRGRRP